MIWLPRFIESCAEDVFGTLARAGHLQGLDRDRFLDRLAEAFADVSAIHPFREGDTGHPLDRRGLGAQQNLHASQVSLRGDLGPLRTVLHHHVAR